MNKPNLSINPARSLAVISVGVLTLLTAACDSRSGSQQNSSQSAPASGTSTDTASSSTTTGTPSGNSSAASSAVPPAGNTETSQATSPSGAGAAPVPQVVTPTDRSTMAAAASGGLFEVEAAKLATERAQSPAVRKFAQMMIDDHSNVNQELQTLAANKGIKEGPTLDEKHAAALEKLRGLKANAFDREYMTQAGLTAHREAITLYEQVSRESNDADWRAFAANKLPALRQHETMILQTAKQVGVPVSAAATKPSKIE
jgi:putative membrane protein